MLKKRLNYRQKDRPGVLFCSVNDKLWPSSATVPYCEFEGFGWPKPPIEKFCQLEPPQFTKLQTFLNSADAHFAPENLTIASSWDGGPTSSSTNVGTVNLTSLNDLPALNFSNNGRHILSRNLFAQANTTRADFIVATANNLSTNPRLLYGSNGTSNNQVNTHGFGFFYNGSVLGYKANNNSATVGVLLSDFNPSNTSFIAAFIGEPGNTQLWINGTLRASGDTLNPASYSNSYIGRPPTSSTTEFWNGSVSEIITWTEFVPATLDVDYLFGYLAHKFSLSEFLPLNHPYKSEFNI